MYDYNRKECRRKSNHHILRLIAVSTSVTVRRSERSERLPTMITMSETKIASVKDKDGDGELEPNVSYRLNDQFEFERVEVKR